MPGTIVLLVFLQSGPLYAHEEDKKLPLWVKKKGQKANLNYWTVDLPSFLEWIVEATFGGDSQSHCGLLKSSKHGWLLELSSSSLTLCLLWTKSCLIEMGAPRDLVRLIKCPLSSWLASLSILFSCNTIYSTPAASLQQSNEGSARGTTSVFTWSCVFLNFAKARWFKCNYSRSPLATLTSSLSRFVSWHLSDGRVLGLAKRKLNWDLCSLVGYFYVACSPFHGHLGEEWLLGILLPPTGWLTQCGWWARARAGGLKDMSQYYGTGSSGVVEGKKVWSKVWEAWLENSYLRRHRIVRRLIPSHIYSPLSGIHFIIPSIQL